MADKKLSAMTAADPFDLTEEFYIVQGGNSRKGNLQQLKNALGQGWVKVNDAATFTEANAKRYLAGVRRLVTLDGDGGSIFNYGGIKGTALADWYLNNAHISSAVGETYAYRLSFRVKKVGVSTDAQILIEQDIGGAIGPIIQTNRTLVKNSGVEQDILISWNGYALDTYLANGAQLFFTPDVDVDIWGLEFFIERISTPVSAG